jgi:hypothetical protein
MSTSAREANSPRVPETSRPLDGKTARLGPGAGCRHTLCELEQDLYLVMDAVNTYYACDGAAARMSL